MDKEKQIEEMAKIIDDRLIEARGYLGSMNKGEGYWIAQRLIEHYRPIIDKDGIVLSKTEYQDLKERANKKIDGLELKIGGASGWFPIEFIKGAIERDLDHDRIVLSREEHEILVKTAQGKIGNMKSNEFIKACLLSGWAIQAVSTEEQVKQARKETAEKILKWLTSKRHLFNRIHEVGFKKPRTSYLVLNDEIEELAKQYGVEIKE